MTTPLPFCVGFWQFGSIGTLAWAAAAALPVLLHLWSRLKYREEPWAAMAFLIAALRKNARRIQLEQWVLLAVRMAILLLFAVALADPRPTSPASSAATEEPRGPTHVVLVIDSSYSMDFRRQGVSRLEAAKQRAREIVAEGQPGDAYSLLVMAEPPQWIISQPTTEASAVLAEISGLTLTHAGANMPATLAQVEVALQEAVKRLPPFVHTRVVFLSDLQQLTWSEASSPDCRARLAQIDQLAAVELIDVGAMQGDNLAVVQLTIEQPQPTTNSDVPIVAGIQSFARDDRPRHAVQFLVDGMRVAEEHVQVPAGGSAAVSIRHRFAAPGEHIVEVRLEDDDLPLDNRRWLSVPVASSIRVLCIGGRPGETRHLALALDPYQQADGPIAVIEAPESRLLEEDLSKFDCLFLCNIGRFSRREANVLERYVKSGGGLVVFLGDLVQPANYNEMLAGEEPSRILPARLGDAAATGQHALDPLDYSHPIVAPFRGFERAGLTTTPIWKYIRAVPSNRATIAARFTSGDPAIVEQRVGRGRCILVTTAASPDSVDAATNPPTPWTAWSAWPSFPPLVQEMLRLVVGGRSKDRNLLVNDVLTMPLPVMAGAAELGITLPDGSRERLAVREEQGAPTIVFDDTAQAGIYDVHAADRQWRVAVNLHPSESNLSRLSMEQLPPELRRQSLATSADRLSPASTASSGLFRWLLGAVLVLLIAEPCLACWLGRGRV